MHFTDAERSLNNWDRFFVFSFFSLPLCFHCFFALNFYLNGAAGSVADVQTAIEHIFPLVYEFRKKRTVEPVPAPVVYDPDDEDELNKLIGTYGSSREKNGAYNSTNRKAIKRKYPFGMAENDPHVDNMIVSDDDLDEDDDIDDEL